MRSNGLTNEERHEMKPSPISSWRLEPGHFPESTSRRAQAAPASQDIHRGFGVPSQKDSAQNSLTT